jgi:hypothetical protein
VSPIVTKRFFVVPISKEFEPDEVAPDSPTCASWIGPDTAGSARNARCAWPNVPLSLQGFFPVLLQALPRHVPLVCSQSQLSEIEVLLPIVSTGSPDERFHCEPEAGGVSWYFVFPPLTVAQTEVVTPVPLMGWSPRSTSATSPAEHDLVEK